MDTHNHSASHDLPLRKLAASATRHCLTGCVIGEVAGLLLGVSLGWQPLTTALVATALAFASGFALTLIPMTLRQGRSVAETFRIVWLGETISIGVMELAMNVIDYLIGGMSAKSVAEPVFWYSMAAAVVAGYLAGYPVNYLMLKHNIKGECH